MEFNRLLLDSSFYDSKFHWSQFVSFEKTALLFPTSTVPNIIAHIPFVLGVKAIILDTLEVHRLRNFKPALYQPQTLFKRAHTAYTPTLGTLESQT